MSDDYLLGDDGGELLRLGVQHRVWSEVTHAAWRRAGFSVGDAIMDVGAGPGFCSLELAQWVGPGGSVLAVDQSEAFLAAVRQRAADEGLRNVHTLRGAVQELELKPATLDGAYMRWILCFLDQPEAAIGRVVSALKPGGKLAILDYFNYRAFTIAPRSAAMDEVVDAIQESWSDAGGSLEIQGNVPGMLVNAGMSVTDVRQVSGIALPGTPQWHWPENFLRGFLPNLVEQGYIDEDLERRFWSDWESRANEPGSFLSLPPLVEIQATRDY